MTPFHCKQQSIVCYTEKKERSNKIGERNCSGERHCLMPMLLFKGSCSRVFYRIAAPKKFVWFSGKHDVVRFLHTRHWRNNLWFWLCSSVHLSVFLPVSPSTTNGNWNGTLVFPEVEIHKLRKLTESDIWKKKSTLVEESPKSPIIGLKMKFLGFFFLETWSIYHVYHSFHLEYGSTIGLLTFC